MVPGHVLTGVRGHAAHQGGDLSLAGPAGFVVRETVSASRFDFPNHRLHHFSVGERTCEHAVATGYRLVPAGGQGSWFGRYGEDAVTTRDTEGRLIYTNACQLLRAIPNGDNVRRIPVPPFKDY